MKLPSDGTRVKAQTYANTSDDEPSREVQGKLSTRSTPLREAQDLGPQCWVDGIQVDPETVEVLHEKPSKDG